LPRYIAEGRVRGESPGRSRISGHPIEGLRLLCKLRNEHEECGRSYRRKASEGCKAPRAANLANELLRFRDILPAFRALGHVIFHAITVSDRHSTIEIACDLELVHMSCSSAGGSHHLEVMTIPAVRIRYTEERMAIARFNRRILRCPAPRGPAATDSGRN
jgi:hypothetical protein